MATSTTLPAKPTFGSHEWLMNNITGSYSSSAQGGQVEAFGDLDLGVLQRQAARASSPCRDVAALDRDDLAAAIGCTANRPRPAIVLG